MLAAFGAFLGGLRVLHTLISHRERIEVYLGQTWPWLHE